MKSIIKNISIISAVLLLVTACKRDDYFIGGSIHNPKVNMTTYDYLKSHPQGLFDTLLMLVDKAGLKDKINEQGVSFFAPTDYAINAYLTVRVLEEQRVDPFRKWTIDSLMKYEMNKFADSINIYLVKQTLTYDKLSANGAVYPTAKAGTNCVVSWEETRDYALGYNPNVSTIPRIVYFTYLLKPITPPIVAGNIPSDQGIRVRVQTSGIQSTTGIVHVLNNQHKLFFRK